MKNEIVLIVLKAQRRMSHSVLFARTVHGVTLSRDLG